MKQFFAIAAAYNRGARQPGALPHGHAPFAAASTGVRTVSVVPTAGRAQVVIGVDASVEVDDFLLESPFRIVIDLKGATLDMAPRYDRLARGGVTNIRAAQFKPNVVRVVIEMDAAHPYEVSRADGEVRVAVSGGVATFDAWHSDGGTVPRTVARIGPPADRSSRPGRAARTTPGARRPAGCRLRAIPIELTCCCAGSGAKRRDHARREHNVDHRPIEQRKQRCRRSDAPHISDRRIGAAADHRHLSGRGHPRRHRRVRLLLRTHHRCRQGRPRNDHRRNQEPAVGRCAPRDSSGTGTCRG